jgi:hypothetical protein
MPDFSNNTVILLDIPIDDYSFFSLSLDWRARLESMPCPGCAKTGQFARHGSYHKFHYHHSIQILRVRCRGCGCTHALIPTFSLPGTSIGSKEAEEYLKARADGEGRGRAGRELVEHGMSGRYPKSLDRMFSTAVRRAKALFPHAADERLSGLPWVFVALGSAERPLVELNLFCLSRGVNAVCFCRASILVFPSRRGRARISHNPGSAAPAIPCLHSG